MTYNIFIKDLKNKRLIKGIKQKDMANLLGISSSKYCKIENGSTEPSFNELISICRILDLSLDSYIKQSQNVNNYKYD